MVSRARYVAYRKIDLLFTWLEFQTAFISASRGTVPAGYLEWLSSERCISHASFDCTRSPSAVAELRIRAFGILSGPTQPPATNGSGLVQGRSGMPTSAHVLICIERSQYSMGVNWRCSLDKPATRKYRDINH